MHYESKEEDNYPKENGGLEIARNREIVTQKIPKDTLLGMTSSIHVASQKFPALLSPAGLHTYEKILI